MDSPIGHDNKLCILELLLAELHALSLVSDDPAEARGIRRACVLIQTHLELTMWKFDGLTRGMMY